MYLTNFNPKKFKTQPNPTPKFSIRTQGNESDVLYTEQIENYSIKTLRLFWWLYSLKGCTKFWIKVDQATDSGSEKYSH